MKIKKGRKLIKYMLLDNREMYGTEHQLFIEKEPVLIFFYNKKPDIDYIKMQIEIMEISKGKKKRAGLKNYIKKIIERLLEWL